METPAFANKTEHKSVMLVSLFGKVLYVAFGYMMIICGIAGVARLDAKDVDIGTF
jgi:hypothetical protein